MFQLWHKLFKNWMRKTLKVRKKKYHLLATKSLEHVQGLINYENINVSSKFMNDLFSIKKIIVLKEQESRKQTSLSQFFNKTSIYRFFHVILYKVDLKRFPRYNDFSCDFYIKVDLERNLDITKPR